MQFHVRVGILPHEREVPQPLELDLSVRCVHPGATTIDYRRLYALTRAVLDAEPLDYLESVGSTLATRVLELDGVASVRVAVRKPHVSLGGPLAYAEVVVEQRHA